MFLCALPQTLANLLGKLLTPLNIQKWELYKLLTILRYITMLKIAIDKSLYIHQLAYHKERILIL